MNGLLRYFSQPLWPQVLTIKNWMLRKLRIKQQRLSLNLNARMQHP